MMNEKRAEKLNSLREQLDALSLADYVELVRNTADTRFKATKNTTSRASYFYEISSICLRYSRLLKG